MNTGFATEATETSFALRSANYLRSQGYTALEVRQALIEELDVHVHSADEIIAALDDETAR